MNKNLIVNLRWYEKDPSLLAAEKAAMSKAFPKFKLKRTEDGRLAWTGIICPGIWKGFDASEDDSAKQSWEVMAVYENDHPHQQTESSIKVFFLSPTLDTLIEHIGWVPQPFLIDNVTGQKYFFTQWNEDIKSMSISAACALARTVSWLTCFELVMTGEITKEEFNEPFGEYGG